MKLFRNLVVIYINVLSWFPYFKVSYSFIRMHTGLTCRISYSFSRPSTLSSLPLTMHQCNRSLISYCFSLCKLIYFPCEHEAKFCFYILLIVKAIVKNKSVNVALLYLGFSI